jgi:hypothetical protein
VAATSPPYPTPEHWAETLDFVPLFLKPRSQKVVSGTTLRLVARSGVLGLDHLTVGAGPARFALSVPSRRRQPGAMLCAI